MRENTERRQNTKPTSERLMKYYSARISDEKASSEAFSVTYSFKRATRNKISFKNTGSRQQVTLSEARNDCDQLSLVLLRILCTRESNKLWCKKVKGLFKNKQKVVKALLSSLFVNSSAVTFTVGHKSPLISVICCTAFIFITSRLNSQTRQSRRNVTFTQEVDLIVTTC